MINIQNIDDNECFKWSVVRYVNLANHHPARITKDNKDFTKRLEFKDIKFQSKLETFTELKKRIPSALVILAMYQKNVVKKNMLTY